MGDKSEIRRAMAVTEAHPDPRPRDGARVPRMVAPHGLRLTPDRHEMVTSSIQTA